MLTIHLSLSIFSLSKNLFLVFQELESLLALDGAFLDTTSFSDFVRLFFVFNRFFGGDGPFMIHLDCSLIEEYND